jgi:SAM-dependent methyltransferase
MPQLRREALEGLPKNGRTDPIQYYRRPFVGYLFRERINMGLRLLGERRFEKALEVGYGAGAVLLTLAPNVRELHGIDLDAEPGPVMKVLDTKGFSTDLRQGSVYELPYDAESFDLVVCFSVFEHLHEYERGLAEVRRVLQPGGTFLLGMPAVNRTMGRLFDLIGHRNIDDDHVTAPAEVAARFRSHGFAVEAQRNLGLPGRGPALYYTWSLRADR